MEIVSGTGVEVTVENRSDIPAEEVVQVYIKGCNEDSVPNRSLCGFQRVRLEPHETKAVHIPVPSAAFQTVLSDGSRGDRYGFGASSAGYIHQLKIGRSRI